jgi:hypothetical protein
MNLALPKMEVLPRVESKRVKILKMLQVVKSNSPEKRRPDLQKIKNLE